MNFVEKNNTYFTKQLEHFQGEYDTLKDYMDSFNFDLAFIQLDDLETQFIETYQKLVKRGCVVDLKLRLAYVNFYNELNCVAEIIEGEMVKLGQFRVQRK